MANKYLELIETLTCLNDLEYEKDIKIQNKLLSDIYIIAHMGNWRCKAHKNDCWEEKVNKLLEEFKD